MVAEDSAVKDEKEKSIVNEGWNRIEGMSEANT